MFGEGVMLLSCQGRRMLEVVPRSESPSRMLRIEGTLWCQV